MRVLVTGGVRSGKSHHAEQLLWDAPDVTYVAAGPSEADEPDPDWAHRLAAHRERRPASWSTVETLDVAAAVAAAPGPVLVDCLGTWVTRTMDARDLWEASSDEAHAVIDAEAARLVGALRESRHAVLVTNEVGLGVVPSHRSGRLFRDLLGTANRLVATECDEVHLVVAGRVLVL